MRGAIALLKAMWTAFVEHDKVPHTLYFIAWPVDIIL